MIQMSKIIWVMLSIEDIQLGQTLSQVSPEVLAWSGLDSGEWKSLE